MTTHIPQVAGTNPVINPFQPELLSHDSSPLICSVTIWWLSAEFWVLGYIILLFYDLLLHITWLCTWDGPESYLVSYEADGIHYIEQKLALAFVLFNPGANLHVKLEDSEGRRHRHRGHLQSMYRHTYPAHLFNQLILFHSLSFLMHFYCIRHYLFLL